MGLCEPTGGNGRNYGEKIKSRLSRDEKIGLGPTREASAGFQGRKCLISQTTSWSRYSGGSSRTRAGRSAGSAWYSRMAVGRGSNCGCFQTELLRSSRACSRGLCGLDEPLVLISSTLPSTLRSAVSSMVMSSGSTGTTWVFFFTFEASFGRQSSIISYIFQVARVCRN